MCDCPRYERKYAGGVLCYCDHPQDSHGIANEAAKRIRELEQFAYPNYELQFLRIGSSGKGPCTRMADSA